MVGVTAASRPNVLDANIGVEMRDPSNLDFRPRNQTRLAYSGAGPYGSGVIVAEVPGGDSCNDGSYWIPGR
eukprot:COSAG06_NODE_7475_length_2491_cov_3.809783_3_plen_71_part_00